MLWGLITKSKLNIVLFLWVFCISITCMAVLSSIPILILRYFYLPQDQVVIPLDFLSKAIKTPSNQYHRELVSASDLTKVHGMANVDYSIDLVLSLPRNEVNLNYGNFGVRSALGDHDWTNSKSSMLENPTVIDSTITKSDIIEKMALIPYKSHFIEALSTYVWSPLYLLGICKEESEIVINLWPSAKRPKMNHPYVLIMLPKDIWVSSAFLQLNARLTGLRWLLKTYPISTFVISSTVFLLLEISGAVIMLMFAYIRLSSGTGSETMQRAVSTVEANQHNAKRSSNKIETGADKHPLLAPSVPQETGLDAEYPHKNSKFLAPYKKTSSTKDSSLGAKEADYDNEKTFVKANDSLDYYGEAAEVGLLSPEYS